MMLRNNAITFVSIILFGCWSSNVVVRVGASALPAQEEYGNYYDLIYNDRLSLYYENENQLSSPPSDTGAIGVNIGYDDAGGGSSSSLLYVEQQRYGAEWIAAGLYNNDNGQEEEEEEEDSNNKVNTGLKILNWIFNQIESKGPYIYQDSNDAVHSTSLFLEAATRAALLLTKNDDGNTNSYVYASTVQFWKPHLKDMAQYIVDKSQIGTHGRDANLEPFAHRYFLRAAGIQGVASLLVLLDDDDADSSSVSSSFSDAAQHLVEEGLSLQTLHGVFPERGGFDFNYQSIGLCYLGRWKFLLQGPTDFEEEITFALIESLPLFTARVDSLGNVDTSDSTRINEPARSGRPKSLDYKTIVQGFLGASAMILLSSSTSSSSTSSAYYESLATLLAQPIRPIVEYKFEGNADGQKSTGLDDTAANLFCRTLTNTKNFTPLGENGSGLTSEFDDKALHLTSSTYQMGEGRGPFCRTDGDVESLDGLASFTLSGYYKSDQIMSNNIELFQTNKLKLTVVNNGKLRLFVDSHSGSDSVVATNADWIARGGEWGFFAVTYDGTQDQNNVKFYSGSDNGSLKLSSTQTLNNGSVDAGSSRLYINRQDRPMVGMLDNMRIFGNKDNNEGALSLENLKDLYEFDIGNEVIIVS